MKDYWTENVQKRGKQGFGSSVETWFEEESLLQLSDQLLKTKDSPIFKLIDFSAAQKFLNKDKKHWNLLQLALWAENNKKYI